ncbi:GRIP and coiled-coil domain-containing protein 2 [Anabarilius grahami]|uniref:GRIP and coiled-coil domain-containing protein 2 n=1 Tax=Anabarilius grahami TaxID=495550 RepID=A0A3N0Y6T2_ANAGA|nr:GRIP and coiled-coil domain-containing protein 2 [Anabarilius grahami]
MTQQDISFTSPRSPAVNTLIKHTHTPEPWLQELTKPALSPQCDNLPLLSFPLKTYLEKEVAVLKHPAPATSDSSVIQELTERMNAVLQEKAESQQSLALLRKQHDEFKRQAQVTYISDAFVKLSATAHLIKHNIHCMQLTLVNMYFQDTERRLAALQEELDLKNRECTEMQENTAELTARFKTACSEYESKISQTQEELDEAKHQWTAATEALKESHQMSLTESQQESENLQREIERINKQYEEDVRYLEEQLELNAADFERERERLLLLQDELSEQLALKEGFLQDVQEEEEDANRAAPPKLPADFPASDDSGDEGGVLKVALEDLQSQNMMFQEELVFLRNVKVELESELKQVREEFAVEKEELEFRINELQMNRDGGEKSADRSGETRSIQTSQESPEELETCFSSRAEGEQTEEALDKLQDRRSPLPEDERMITREQVDLRDRTVHFITQYKAMKEQTVASVQGLQEKLESILQEHIRNTEDMSDQEVKMPFEDLRSKTEELLGNLQHKETLVLEFEESLKLVEREHKAETQLLSETVEKDERIKILEEEISALRSTQEECRDSIKLLQSQIVCLSEERNALQRDMDASQEHLSEVQCHVAEILRQSFSETEVDGTADVSTLINRLLNRSQEEKALLTQQCAESVERWTADLESARQSTEELQERIDELLREKLLLKASLDDVVLDTEGLQKDLSEMQAMNEKLRAENHSLLTQVRSLEEKEPADETDAQVHEDNGLQQVLADKDSLISQLQEEVGHLQNYSIKSNRDIFHSIVHFQMCKESSVSDENEKMKGLSHEIEMLKKESKDKDERMNKIKAVAVKAKKELDSSKKEAVALREEVEQLKAERDRLSRSMKDIIHGAEDYKNLMVDYDKQTELLDQEREKLEQANKHNEDLTRRLQNALQQVSQ